MPILTGTLARYFGLRFLIAVMLVFAGIFALVAMLNYIEQVRRYSDIANMSMLLVAKLSICRVPQVTERVLPFCVLIGAMYSFLDLSRRLELVIARSAGLSAWQFISPALAVAFVIGIFSTAVYNPWAAAMQERSKRYEAQLSGHSRAELLSNGGAFWGSQQTADGQAIINAKSSQEQGIDLSGVTVFTFDRKNHFRNRIEAAEAVLHPGVWLLSDAHIYAVGHRPLDEPVYRLKTSLTPEQVRESFATPETVPFWELPLYIKIAEHAGLVAAGYRLQFQKLLARPFLLVAMVFLAAAVSLRFFRFGGVQKMVLSGIVAGFLLYVLSKVTDDLSKAELMSPTAAAWLPVLAGGLTGFIALLYQEDG
jgi:lipopolysaccharide export system permease protein